MIYIKFEKLRTLAGTPALLGVLAPEPNAFSVYVLEPALAPAAAASRSCRVADMHAAVSAILAMPGHRIVSWTEHERRLVQAGGVPASLVKQFDTRWCDALADVRRWKNRLYRGWELPPARGAGAQMLKRYMEAIGYSRPANLPRGNAAQWLSHVLRRLEACGGRYGDLSPATKNAWHAVIDHNRHVCTGIRAVHARALRELALHAAYCRTTYRVDTGDGLHSIVVGRRHRALDAMLRARGVRTWACITAYNPQSEPQPHRENERRNVQLRRVLEQLQVRWLATEAIADDGEWPPEHGVLALDISRARAESVARSFGQAAIMWGVVGGTPELVWCNRLPRATRRRPDPGLRGSLPLRTRG